MSYGFKRPGRSQWWKISPSTGVILLALAMLLFGLREGWTMGMFDRLVLFSEVHGTVLQDGRPVAGAELIQKVVWSENENEIPPQQTVTDEKGTFRFPVIERAAWLRRLIPSQPAMLQNIVIRYRGVEYIAWRHGKMSWDVNTELDGRPLDLVCELRREPSQEGTHYGICRVR